MTIRPIRTDADYQAALKEIDALLESAPGTPGADRLDILTTLVEAYEDRHIVIPSPDPIEAIQYFMETRGFTLKDLEPLIGNKERVSEILNRRRPLTLRMIRRLHDALGIPAEILLTTYTLKRPQARKSATGRAKRDAQGTRQRIRT